MSIHPRHRRLFLLGLGCIAVLSALAGFYIAETMFPPSYSDFAGVLRLPCLIPAFLIVFGPLLIVFVLILGIMSRGR